MGPAFLLYPMQNEKAGRVSGPALVFGVCRLAALRARGAAENIQHIDQILRPPLQQ